MLRVKTIWTAPQGGPYFTQVHFDGLNAAQAATAHDAMADLWAALAAQISNAYSWQVDGEVDSVAPATGQIIEQFNIAAVNGVGSSTGQPLPFTTQGLIRWTTGFFQAGRQVRGRTFVPGLTENSTQGGKPDAAFVNTVNGVISAWLTNVPAGVKPVIWSPTAGTATVVNGSSFWNQFAVLRSRRD